MEIIKEELLLKDIEFLEKRETECDAKLARYPSDKEAQEEKELLNKIRNLMVT